MAHPAYGIISEREAPGVLLCSRREVRVLQGPPIEAIKFGVARVEGVGERSRVRRRGAPGGKENARIQIDVQVLAAGGQRDLHEIARAICAAAVEIAKSETGGSVGC